MAFWGDIFSTTSILILAAIILVVWVLVEFKRFRHQIFAIFLIIFIVFLYVGAVKVFKDTSVDFSSPSGMVDAGKLYFSWLFSAFGNIKTITSNVIHTDWSGNSTKS